MYRPTELNDFLNRLGIKPKKGLSQNFLIDGNIIRKIIATAQVAPKDQVLEIGPGPGALTQALLAAEAHVIAVEKDPILAEHLTRLQVQDQRLQVFCQDILDFPLANLDNKTKVIANLPYHLTTPILVHLLSRSSLFSSITVMVQEEVARRFTAKPNSKEYSSFTLFLNFYTNPQYAFFVSRNCFYPVPNVDSAVVILHLKEPPTLENRDLFFRVTRTAFEHRRKMLRSSLKSLMPAPLISQALEKMGKNALSRPENLSLEDFLQFYDLIKDHLTNKP